MKKLQILEDLNVKGMAANRRLAKHIGDAGWGKENMDMWGWSYIGQGHKCK